MSHDPDVTHGKAPPGIEFGRVIYVSEGRQVVRANEKILYHIIWAEFALISSPITTAYRRGTDVSSLYYPR